MYVVEINELLLLLLYLITKLFLYSKLNEVAKITDIKYGLNVASITFCLSASLKVV